MASSPPRQATSLRPARPPVRTAMLQVPANRHMSSYSRRETLPKAALVRRTMAHPLVSPLSLK
jgi:hypothetical protein